MFDDIVDVATIGDLATLTMPIRLENAAGDNQTIVCNLSALPDEQLVLPTELISCPQGSSIELVSVRGKGNIVVAITKDNNTYQIYNFKSNMWETINLDDIGTKGMVYTTVENITKESWEEYNPIEIGFAFFLKAENGEDVTEVNKIVINYVGDE